MDGNQKKQMKMIKSIVYYNKVKFCDVMFLNIIHKIFRFGIMTAFSAGVNMGGSIALKELAGFSPEQAFAIALITVFVLNFYLLRYFVFYGRNQKISKQVMKYTIFAICFRGTEYIGFLIIFKLIVFDYKLAILIILVVSLVMKFIFYNWLFDSQKNTI